MEGGTIVVLLSFSMLALGVTVGLFSMKEYSTLFGSKASLSQTWDAHGGGVMYGSWLYPGWMLVLLYQLLWLLYSFTTLRRKVGRILLYQHLPVMPALIYVFFLIGMLCIIGWLYLFADSFYYPVASITGVLAFVFLGVSLSISLGAVHDHEMLMRLNRLDTDLRAILVLVQNGLAFCLTWLLFVSVTSALSILPTTHGVVTDDVTSGVLLTLIVYTVVWVALDNGAGRCRTTYLFSPYLALFLIFLGILIRHLDKATYHRNYIVAVIALALTVGAALIKAVAVGIRVHREIQTVAGSEILQSDDGSRFQEWRNEQNRTMGSASGHFSTSDRRAMQEVLCELRIRQQSMQIAPALPRRDYSKHLSNYS